MSLESVPDDWEFCWVRVKGDGTAYVEHVFSFPPKRTARENDGQKSLSWIPSWWIIVERKDLEEVCPP